MSALPQSPDNRVSERLQALEAKIAEACARAGRKRSDVTLVGISKFHSVDAMRSAYAGGLRNFGENYAQEMSAKMAELNAVAPEICWHFTGRVQRNKAKLMAGCHWIHGVSSETGLRVLTEKAPGANFLLQMSEEEQKKGFTFDGLRREFEALLRVAGARLQGLMSLPPAGQTPTARRAHFAALRRLRETLEAEFAIELPHLSMGMSADFEVAIEEGATFIRVGTAIFGSRPVA